MTTPPATPTATPIEAGRRLTFAIIGAQKAATTSVFHWLADHPQLHLPAGKEVPFFDQLPAPGTDATRTYLQRTFGPVDGRRRGTATPQYMCHPHAADALADQFPDLLLIALLRDPIARARSHWRMRVRLGYETRTFATAIADQLAEPAGPNKTSDLVGNIEEEDGYVAYGEYGRILARYLTRFPRSQLLVAYDDAAAQRPAELVTRLCAFLGVDDHQPAGGYTVRYNAGPVRQRRLERLFWTIVPYRILHRLLPGPVRQRLGAVLDRFGLNRPVEHLDDTLPDELRRQLVDHYRTDAARLADAEIDAPWLTSWDTRPAPHTT